MVNYSQKVNSNTGDASAMSNDRHRRFGMAGMPYDEDGFFLVQDSDVEVRRLRRAHESNEK
jgi:hypothetical protein